MSISRYESVDDLDRYTIQISKQLKNTPLSILRKGIANAEGYKGYEALCHAIKNRKMDKSLFGEHRRNLVANTFDEELDILAG